MMIVSNISNNEEFVMLGINGKEKIVYNDGDAVEFTPDGWQTVYPGIIHSCSIRKPSV